MHNNNCKVDAALDQATIRTEQISVVGNGQPPCFAAGTLVHTRDGLKPIEGIQVGDWVLSYPDDQARPRRIRLENEYIYKQVTRVFVTEDQPLCRLIVANMASGDREEFLVTPQHPIYCQGRGWISTSKIDVGDCVEQFEFANLIVFRNYQNVETGRVYNFEVEDFHTYYVGKEGLWVHNTCSPPSMNRKTAGQTSWDFPPPMALAARAHEAGSVTSRA